MKLLDTIRNAFSKGSRTYPALLSSLFSRRYSSTGEEYADNARAYQERPYVYASVFQLAQSLAQLPIRLYKIIILPDGTKETIELDLEADADNPLISILHSPNDEMTWYDLIEAIVTSLELGGDSYLEVSYNKLDVPTALYPLRPDRVVPKPGSTNKKIDGYVYKVGSGNPIWFNPEEIIHIKYYNPLSDLTGQPGISAASSSVSMEKAAMDYNQDYLDNDATVPGLLSTEQPVSQEEADRIEAIWNKKVQGGRGRTVLLPKGLKYDQLGSTPKDLEFLSLLKHVGQEELAVLGVPPSKVGLLEYAKYANYDLQNRAFYEDTIKPKAAKISSAFNKDLLPLFHSKKQDGTSVRYNFEFDFRYILGESAADLALRYTRLFSVGAVTPNEIRDALNLGEQYEGGDHHFVSRNMAPLSDFESMLEQEEPELTQDEIQEELSEIDTEEDLEEEEETI